MADKERQGSNGIAIAPGLTANGHALLLINPHTSWYFRSELQMSSDEGLDAYGAATWGQFFIYQGFNPHVGWMHTSSGVDVVDEFAEKIERRGKSRCYRFGSACNPLGVRPVTIRYRLPNGKLGSRSFTTYFTHHGPIVRAENGRWIAFAMMNRPVEALQQSYLRTKATDLASFMQIAQLKANSSNNTIFADDKGEIAYLHPQFVPRRDDRFDYTKPVDGSDPATDWGSLHSLSELPNVVSPPNGWVDNNNNAPWSAAGAFSPKAANYPEVHGHVRREFPRGSRAAAADSQPRLELEKLNAAAFDSFQPGFAALIPGLIAGLRSFADDRPAPRPLLGADRDASGLELPVERAVGAADAGDGLGAEAEGRAQCARRRAVEQGDDAPRARHDAGQKLDRRSMTPSADLQRDFGRWNVPWGEINRAQRISADIANPNSTTPRPASPCRSPTPISARSPRSGRGPSRRRSGGTATMATASSRWSSSARESAPALSPRAAKAAILTRRISTTRRSATRQAHCGRSISTPIELKGHTERVYRPGE